MKKTGIAVLFGLLLLSGLRVPLTTADNAPFTDIHNSYARSEITRLHKQGIVKGDGNGRFHPGQPVTRAEFVTMLGRTLGVNPVFSPLQAFRDVPRAHWANGWIHAAVQSSIAQGTSPVTFAPAHAISRQEAAVMIMRAYSRQTGISPSDVLQDQHEVAQWALPSVKQAVDSGLMTGFDGRFRPRATLTREELAVIVSRMVGVPASGSGVERPSIQLAWQYGGTTGDFIKQVQHTPVNVLSPRWFFLDKSGNVTDSGDASLVKWAHENNKQVWAMVGNRFQADVTHQLVSQEARRKAFMERIVHLSEKYRLDGINLDFENVKASDRRDFSVFIRELSQVLREKGVLLSVDVPPDLGNSWSAAYDYEELGRHVDYLVIMTYDEHWSGSPRAGSVSSLPWFEQHLRNITARVPAKKIIAGMPLYTRDWFVANGKVESRDLLIQEQYDLLAQKKPRIAWEPNMAQYVATYTQSSVVHTIWVEDSRSIAEKIKASRALGISGTAYWHLGGGTRDIWTTVDNIGKLHAR